MEYRKRYKSPIGDMLLSADDKGLRGLWLENEKYFPSDDDREFCYDNIPESVNLVLTESEKWLDIYFSGENPDFTPKLNLIGSDFRKEVWEELLKIPYGSTITYGEIGRTIAGRRGLGKMSAQAIGGAVGHNEISIIVPCHRVVGADRSLTGYAGGLDRKRYLLELEGHRINDKDIVIFDEEYKDKSPICDYIDMQPFEHRERLVELYRVMRESLPNVTEKISWGMPTFWQGKNIIHFACQKKHIGIYPGVEAIEVFAEELKNFKTGKGSIQIPYKNELPVTLIRKLTSWCYENNR